MKGEGWRRKGNENGGKKYIFKDLTELTFTEYEIPIT